MMPFETMSRDELLQALKAFARNWLAHDGCWFLAAEERFGMATAIELDAAAWKRFAVVEARRLIELFGVPHGGGLQALRRALSLTDVHAAQPAATGVAGRRTDVAPRDGRVPRPGGPAPEGPRAVPVPPGGRGGVRLIRHDYRPSHQDALRQLSARSERERRLHVGVHAGRVGSLPPRSAASACVAGTREGAVRRAHTSINVEPTMVRLIARPLHSPRTPHPSQKHAA